MNLLSHVATELLSSMRHKKPLPIARLADPLPIAVLAPLDGVTNLFGPVPTNTHYSKRIDDGAALDADLSAAIVSLARERAEDAEADLLAETERADDAHGRVLIIEKDLAASQARIVELEAALAVKAAPKRRAARKSKVA